MDAVVVTGSSGGHRCRRTKGGGSGHVVAQLLESPLPTPRRSCCGRRPSAGGDDTPAAAASRGCGAGADASPQRSGHVPFKWESSPGVPKSTAAVVGGKPERGKVPLPPKPPPGRCGTCHAARAYYHHSNTTDSSSAQRDDDDDGDGDTFSDALDRISSSDRLAALSARLSAIDGAVVFGSSRSRRSLSFIMDRFLPAANAIASTSADKHRPRPRRPPAPPRRSSSESRRDREAEEAAAAAAARATRLVTRIRRRALALEEDAAAHARARARAQLPPPCAREEAREEEEMTPRACGFMLFVPWSAKPVLLGFGQRSPARSLSQATTPRGDVASVTSTAAASSPPRRSVTLGDVLEKDREVRDDGGGLSKSGSGKEWANPGWGMALLGSSRRYCADARKALSRLTRSGTGMDSGGSPRIGRDRSGKHRQQAVSMLRSTSIKMPPLSPPSESWLSNARRSNAGTGSSKS